jgi:hypothetical protein
MARSCVVAVAVASLMAVAKPGALGLDNGMGLLPIRGVSSWCVQGQVSNTLHLHVANLTILHHDREPMGH